MYKKLYLAGFVAYAAMLVFSVLFYKERVIFLDMAFTIFNIAKDKFFCIQVFRFGDALNQLLPVLTARAGLPLSVVAGSYSVGFVLYYLACYFVTGSVLKRYDFALVILLLNALFAADTFYWIQSQLPQGSAFLMLLFAMVCEKKLGTTKPLVWGILFFSLLTLAFFHPLLVFVVVYAVLFFLQKKTVFAEQKFLYLLLAFYFFAVLLKAVAFKTQYEAHSLSGLKNFATQFPHYFTLYSDKLFLHNLIFKFYWITPVFAAIVAVYARVGEWRRLFVFLCFLLGYLMLVNISYPSEITPEFYIENLYLPLALFLSLPFVFDVMPLLEHKKILFPVFCLILLTGCIRFYTTHWSYTYRLAWERQCLATYADKKIILDAKKVHADALMMLWGTPYEFWLLSTIEQNKSASIIVDDDPPHRDWASGLHQSFLVNWNVYEYKVLNPQYFHFTDTTSGYIIDR